MATTEPVMGLSIPALNADPGVWDTAINSSLVTVASHTHESGSGVRLKPAALNINSDLTFAGNAATNLKAANFFAQAAYTVNKSLWVNSANDDLYYRRAGTDNRLTVGGVLNVSLVGGITGDYAAASAALYYDDAAEAYRFLEAAPAPNDWSYVKAGGFDLYEHDSGIANFIGLRSPTLLAASYNLTFPGALPGSTLLQQVSSAGVISWSNTIANAVTHSAAATFSSTVTFSGAATTGLTASVNQHFTVSGTGHFKHGDRLKATNPMTAAAVDPADFTRTGSALQSTAAGIAYVCPEFDVGQRVKSVSIERAGDGAVDVTFTVFVVTGGTPSQIGNDTVTNVGAAGFTVIDLTDTTVATGGSIVLEIDVNAANLVVSQVEWTYDRP